MISKLTTKQRLSLIKRYLKKKEEATRLCREAGISRVLFYRWLKRYKETNLKVNSLAPLTRHSKVSRKLLSPKERLATIEKKLEGKPVAKICQEYGISRTIFYRWKSRYEQAPLGQKMEALWDKIPKREKYYRQTPRLVEETILTLVIRYPELSTHKIVACLPQVNGKPILGNHGVQNVLRRLDLSYYYQRLAYAKTHAPNSLVQLATSNINRIRTVFEAFTPSLAPAPPPSFKKIFKSFFLSFGFSAFVSYLLLTWLKIYSQAPQENKLGIVFASIALFSGSVFFLYSLKYYLTLAIVLGFSRHVGESSSESGVMSYGKGGDQELGNRKQSWFTRVLLKVMGLTGYELGVGGYEKKHGYVGGLQPNLEGVTLSRSPFVSIHLPMYNEKKVVNRLLSACTSMDYPNYEVIVVDDSNDETTTILQDWKNHPQVKLIHRETREGYKGGALKEALKMTDPRTEFVLVFDSDFVPYPDTITQFLKYFQSVCGTLDFQSVRELGASECQNVRESESQSIRMSESQTAGGSEFSGSPSSLSSPSNIAAIQGYQWHVLNKSENWITRGVRSEYAGSYVVERSGTEVYGGLKQIAGSVYMIRMDLLKKFGWLTSITEDFQLTLRLYEQGYKVIYTPYIQGPAECVSTIKRLVRQRMRWAEGHSYNVKKMFLRLLLGQWVNVGQGGLGEELKTQNSKLKTYDQRLTTNDQTKVWQPSQLTLMEKLEFLYLSPYYLQAAFFLLGTLCWFVSEAVFKARLPFWTALWGWSLVLTNMFSLPLMNTVGLFLEESEEKDYVGILSFTILSYLLVPFQAYASVKGFLEKEEGPWFRTPKTGMVTDVLTRGRFYRWISGILPGFRTNERLASSNLASSYEGNEDQKLNARSYQLNANLNPYLALKTANNRFENLTFRIKRKRFRYLSTVFIVFLLVLSLTVGSMALRVPTAEAADFLLYFHSELASADTVNYPNISTAYQLQTSSPNNTSDELCGKYGKGAIGNIYYNGTGTNCNTALPTGEPTGGTGGNFYISQSGTYPAASAADPWSFDVRLRNPTVGATTGDFMLFVKVFTYNGSSYTTVLYSIYKSSGTSNCTTTPNPSKPDRTSGTAIIPSTTAYTISWTCDNAPAIDMGTGTYLYIQSFIEINTASTSAAASLAPVREGSEVTNCDVVGQGCTKIQTTNFGVPENLLVLLPIIPLLPKVSQGLPALLKRLSWRVKKKGRKK